MRHKIAHFFVANLRNSLLLRAIRASIWAIFHPNPLVPELIRTSLNINPETVCFIIAKSRQFHAKEEVSIPEVPTSPADDWALQVLADHSDDLCFQEIQATIFDLEPDQMIELVGLMWLGRGDAELSEWDNILQDVAAAINKNTPNYLMAHPMVAEYLTEGLIQHGYSCEE